MSKPLVILGTARQHGETRRAVDLAFPVGTVDIISLGEHRISCYDYAHANADDDFLAIADAMVIASTIVFATPVYWYSMSGTMKTFIDRFTDLVEISKVRGRRLAGRNVWLITSGTDLALPDGFEVPFLHTARYFAMHYREACYLFTGNDAQVRQQSEEALTSFGKRVLS